MRVLLSPSRYLPALGGIEEVTRIIAKKLVANGHEVEIWSHAHHPKLSREDEIDGIRIRRFDFPLPSSGVVSLLSFLIKGPLTKLRVRKALLQFNPNVINLHGVSGNAAYLMPLSRMGRIPTVVSTHGETFMDSNDIFTKSLVMRSVFRYSVKTTSYLTAPSRYILDRVTEISRLPDKFRVVPNGVEPNSFEDQEVRSISMMKSADYFVFAGRISKKKGLETLIEAITLLIPDWPEITLKVCGEGEDLDRMKCLVSTLGLDNSVQFLGKLDKIQLHTQLLSAVALIIPSEVEPFGMSALEAMSLGVPVVGTNIGGITEVCGDAALLVDCRNALKLSQTMLSLKSTSVRNELSKKGKSQSKNFTAQRMVSAYENIYYDILNKVQT